MPRFFSKKRVESRGNASGRAPLKRGTPLCLLKRRRGSKGEPSPGVPPFIYSWVCACAPIRWEVVVALSCLSTPFLWCLPKETVSSRQRKALFLPRRLHHSRERCRSVVGTFLARLGAGLVLVGGGYVCADTLGGCRCPVLPFDPISLVLAQRNGVEPPKKSAFEASTSPWWAHPPLPFGSKPQRDKLVRQVGLYTVG